MRRREAEPRRVRQRFAGSITGLGTREGTRAVVGHWPVSPFGPFADVMVERADGHRLLLAPDDDVAEFVSATYVFDEVVTTPVDVVVDGDRRAVRAGPLDLWFVVGGRTALGHLLRAVPGPLAESPGWARLTDPGAATTSAQRRVHGARGRWWRSRRVWARRCTRPNGRWRWRRRWPTSRWSRTR
ncbi:hypothetical protein [Georgenia sp. SUBG003]|uniref:hypothetical protein n=1 Tax=Georgenia sp. SUBG003 TaxID=1497974 RepID=UPI003AB33B89